MPIDTSPSATLAGSAAASRAVGGLTLSCVAGAAVLVGAAVAAASSGNGNGNGNTSGTGCTSGN